MRIVFLCKRRYMGKDVIADRYARLYEIPYQLARLGHSVLALCVSYQPHEESIWRHDAPPGELMWESRSVAGLRMAKAPFFPKWMLKRLRRFSPDVIIGASDIPHVTIGAWLARRLRVPYASDLYDNFEGFGQARIPGTVATLRRAVRNASLVTTTSNTLADMVRNHYKARGDVISMPSTIDKSVFFAGNRAASRKRLQLPLDAPLIGTAGGLRKDRGIGVLYNAWKILSRVAPTIELVLAGPLDRNFPPPDDPRVHYLGELPHARTAELFNALDVGVIYLRDTAFGRYCFPQKAYEMLACDLPVVATDVGAMGALLTDTPACLYREDDADHLAARLRAQLAAPVMPDVPVEDWATVVGGLDRRLRDVVGRWER